MQHVLSLRSWLTAVLAGLLAGVSGCADDSQSRTPGSATSAAAPADNAQVITLITGDRVTLTKVGDATHVLIARGPGRTGVSFLQQRLRDDIVVIPSDVAIAVASGAIDRSLFNVTRLISDGFGDAARDDIPLLITGHAGSAATAVVPHLARDISISLALPRFDAIAVRQRKATMQGVLAALAPAGLTAGTTALPAGQRIWLDAELRPLLDHSVPQIGAPAAWAEGLTGAGVIVAVVDSGIDDAHPDLAGKVIAKRSFLPFDAGADSSGHATHIASTIAGSGAASDGRYRGVAPDAQLVSAQVCRGACPTSLVLAGIEWAVVEQHARIVNLSLGAADREGVDPVEQAVNTLSAEYGTLFVVAAGNEGPATVAGGTIASPGSAEAALTVGAIDRAEQIASFSSRGPRLGDRGIKPEITAPGVGIVAAQAAGAVIGTPVGTSYLDLSGTSMATPHVVGAAALLMQQHPDWTGAQIKAALIGSASPSPALTVFEQGAGRVDVAQAIRQSLSAEPVSIHFGVDGWPHEDDPPRVQTVRYHNAGTAPITVALDAQLRRPDGAVAAAMATVEPGELTIPAGGSAEAVVTIETDGAISDGMYTGALIARGGGARVVTPIAVEREAESFNLTLRVTDRSGRPGSGVLTLVAWRDDERAKPSLMVGGQTTLRLPRARYSAYLTAFDLSTGRLQLVPMTYPRIELDRDLTIDLDTRLAMPTDVQVSGVDLRFRNGTWINWQRTPDFSSSFWSDAPVLTAHLGPSSADDEVRGVFHGTWVRTSAAGDDQRSLYLLGHGELGRALNGWTQTIEPHQLATVAASHGGAAVGTQFKLHEGWLDVERLRGRAGFLVIDLEYPGAFESTEHYFGAGMTWSRAFFSPDGTWWALPQRFRAGRVYTETWLRHSLQPSFAPFFDRRLVTRTGDVLRLDPATHSDAAERWARVDLARLHDRLYRNGQLVFDADIEFRSDLLVPPGPASYRFETEAIRPEGAELSTRIAAAWTFPSQHAAAPVDLGLLGVRWSPVIDERGLSPRGVRPIAIELLRSDDAPIGGVSDLSLETSFDDGATWQRLLVIPLPGQPFALIHPPRDATYVSLRGTAAAGEGRRVEQTIVRAYKLE